MKSIITILLFTAMYLILSGYYEEKIDNLRKQKRKKPEYVPAPTYDMMLDESNKLIPEQGDEEPDEIEDSLAATSF